MGWRKLTGTDALDALETTAAGSVMGEGVRLVGLNWRPGAGVGVLFCFLGIKIKDKKS